MDIDGILRCPRCFGIWDEAHCAACGYNAKVGSGASGFCLEEESVLDGRYLIGVVLGTGGFGITYAAWDLKLDVRVAIKEYFPSALASRDTSETDEVASCLGGENARAFAAGLNRFIREARVLALLNTHPEIVSIRDCIEENNTAYIIMEYLRGITLQSYADSLGGRVSPRKLLSMMKEPIEALGKIHAMGMLHRDVSPANLMLEPDGRVKLIDFGAAIDYAQIGAGQNATVIFNRRYAAPEQIKPDGALGPWTDVHGICATLYALLTGKAPWEALGKRIGVPPPLRAQGVNISRRQERAILRGLAENPKGRVQSIPELMSPLYGVPLPEELRQRKRLLRTAIASISATLFISLAVLLNALWGIPGSGGLYYRLGLDGFSVSGYTGNATSISHQNRLFGISVARIGEMAFHYNSGMTEFEIGEGVTSIESFAFAGCKTLRTVFIPDSIQFIAADAFDGCDERLTLYGTAETYTAKYAAEHGIRFCDPALFIAVVENGEATITHMAEHAADYYEELVIPPFHSGVPVTSIDRDDEVYHPYPAIRLVLPDTLRHIGEYAFMQPALNEPPQLETVVMPEGLKTIGSFAFQYAEFKSLVIPSTVTSIGMSAFDFCPQLEEVQLPSSLISMGPNAFMRCYRLKEINLPDALLNINEYAFASCENLTEVSLPAGLRFIGDKAFRSCRRLPSIIIPEGTEHIGEKTFLDCITLSRAIIPASVKRIGEEAFSRCATDLTIYGCAGSTAEAYAVASEINFVDMARWTPIEAFDYTIDDGGATITAYTGGYEDVVIPDLIEGIEVTGLADALFRFDDVIRSVALPQMVREIPDYCFHGCDALMSVEMPDMLLRVGEGAFIECDSIKEIVLPPSVSYIGSGAFDFCPSLESVTIPERAYRN